MIAISFLTAVIAVVIYHFAIVAVNHFCTPEEEAVYCKCHNAVSEEDENEGKKKEFRRGDRGAKGKKGFGRQMSPEMREKISKMSPEERREFFAKLRQKKGKGAPGRPQRPQKHQHHGNNAEPAPQE